jgi:hypothetical protein
MAWGGQNRGHFDTSAVSPNLIDLLRSLRVSNRTRAEDFERTKTAARGIRGIGISYYTKLLYFFRPTEDAYILDQWTGKSACLRTSPPVVRLGNINRHTGFAQPAQDTTGMEYEAFCAFVDNLALKLWPADLAAGGGAAEAALFDVGNGHGRWRNFVVPNFKHTVASPLLTGGAESLTKPGDWEARRLILREPRGRIRVIVLDDRAGALNNLPRRLRGLREPRWQEIVLVIPQEAQPSPELLAAVDGLGIPIERAHRAGEGEPRRRGQRPRPTAEFGQITLAGISAENLPSAPLPPTRTPRNQAPKGVTQVELTWTKRTYKKIHWAGQLLPNIGYIMPYGNQAWIAVYHDLNTLLTTAGANPAGMPGFRAGYLPGGGPQRKIYGSIPFLGINAATQWLSNHLHVGNSQQSP